MKIRALFAGILGFVNIVAPMAAQAAEEAVSDKADWLKKMVSVGETKESTMPKLTVADIAPRAKKKSALRPFMANRPLPRKSDLTAAAQFAQPSMDESLSNQIPVGLSSSKMVVVSQESPLSGQVSLNSAVSMDQDKDMAYKAVTTTLTKINNMRKHSTAMLPLKRSGSQIVPEPPRAESANLNRAQVTGLPSHVINDVDIAPAAQMASVDTNSMSLSPAERGLIEKLAESMKNGDSQTPSGADTIAVNSMEELQELTQNEGTAGPAPFPLNLLPQGALKGLVGGHGRRSQIATQPVRFGSWHQLASNSLPATGFRSHIPNVGTVRVSYAPRYSHAPVGARSLANSVKQIATRHVSTALARYAPYTNSSRVYLF